MERNKKDSSTYIHELEDKIVDLSLQLKRETNALNLVYETNKKTIGKLVHNLKNPVGIIFSFSDMILEDVEDYDTEKLKKHLQIIKTSADFSIQLLNTIAKYSQLQSPDLNFLFKKLNYSELVSAIINEFDSMALEKNILIEQNYPENSIFLTLDEEEISIAIRNVINNAIRYSKENAIIKIIIKEALDVVETIILDEGIGISEENLPFVINEFFVVNTYSEDSKKCIGLGLPIATKIIEQHKGKIAITSTINKGSSFKITLPKN